MKIPKLINKKRLTKKEWLELTVFANNEIKEWEAFKEMIDKKLVTKKHGKITI